jgi:hypothetical protein
MYPDGEAPLVAFSIVASRASVSWYADVDAQPCDGDKTAEIANGFESTVTLVTSYDSDKRNCDDRPNPKGRLRSNTAVLTTSTDGVKPPEMETSPDCVSR